MKFSYRKKGRSVEARFFDFVMPEPNSGCWLWVGGLSGSGYGSFTDEDGRCPAHRYSWKLHCGPVPDGLLVCHKCDVRPCVNPEHLFIGTQSDNLNDMVAKGRDNPRRGETSGKARLTESDVSDIRRDTRPLKVIGASYGITKSYVWHIKRGRYWQHSHDESVVDSIVLRRANGKLIRARGEGHHKAVLTEEVVSSIRNDFRSSRLLGKIYGVSKTQILRVRSGKSWRHSCV